MRAPRFLLTAAVAAAMTLPASGAVAAPPGTPTCGATVSSDAVLTEDLVCPDGRGLTLLAGADLDLGGHRLVGPGDDLTRGVTLEAGESSSVTNGTIEGWGIGVGFEFSLDAPEAVSDVRGVIFRDNGLGVQTGSGQAHVVRSSQFIRNRTGISSQTAVVTVHDSAFVENDTAASVSFGQARFEDSSFVRNDTAIDCLDLGLTVERSTFVRNGSGIGAFECDVRLVAGSTFSRNGTAYSSLLSVGDDQVTRNTFVNNDVAFDGLSSAHLTENRFTGNETAVRAPLDNPPTGPAFLTLERNRFTRNGDAIVLEGPAELGENVAIANRGYGIYAPQAIDLGGNVAVANGREPQCTGVVCAGP